MNWLVRFSLRNSAVLLLVILIVVVAGLFAMRNLRQELLPDIKFPVITVITPYPLAGPEIVESQVSKPLEAALAGLPQLETVTSNSNANVSVIVLEFDFGVNLQDAENRVSQAVNRVRPSLPEGVQDPTVAAIRFTDAPVMNLSLASSLSAGELKTRVDERVLPKLEALTGVGRVDLTGAAPAQVRVTLNEENMAKYRLDANTIAQALRLANLSLPVGSVQENGLSIPVKIDALAKTIADLAGVVVTAVPDEDELKRLQDEARTAAEQAAQAQIQAAQAQAAAIGRVSALAGQALGAAGRATGTAGQALGAARGASQVAGQALGTARGAATAAQAAGKAAAAAGQTAAKASQTANAAATQAANALKSANEAREIAKAADAKASQNVTNPSTPAPTPTTPNSTAPTPTTPNSTAPMTEPATPDGAVPPVAAPSTSTPGPASVASPTVDTPSMAADGSSVTAAQTDLGSTQGFSSQADEASTSFAASPNDFSAAAGSAAGFPGAGFSGSGAAASVKLRPVLLSEVATIEPTTATPTSFTRLNGKTALGLSIFKTQEANTLQVTKAIREALPALAKAFGGEIKVISDQGKPIEESVSGLLKEGGLGGLFAVIVVLLFLGNLRSTLVTALSIPLSILVALLLLETQGLTLNVLTLGGLTIAIGRVIDDAIVVIENIYHKLAIGLSPFWAAYEGAREVATPVTSSTITTVAVFLPLAFVGGIAGEFFRPLALAVTWAILASLLVAFTVVPLFSNFFLKKAPVSAAKPSLIERLYRPVIRWVLGHRAITLIVALLALVGASALVRGIPTNFVGGGEPTAVNVSLTLPPGTPLAAIDSEARKLETKLETLRTSRRLASYQTVVGGAQNAFAIALSASSGASSNFTVLPVEGQKIEPLRALLERELRGVATGDLVVQAGQGGSGFSQNIEVRLKAADLPTLRQAADLTLATFRKISEVRNPKSNLAASAREFSVRVDAAQAYRAGVIPATVSASVRVALSGLSATQLNVDDQSLDVFLTFPEGTYGTKQALEGLKLRTTSGSSVALGEIAKVEEVPGPTSIVRVNSERTASITAEPAVTNLTEATTAVRTAMTALKLPLGASWELAGVSAQQADSFRSLGLAILAAVALVYLIMVATFRSLLTPLVLLVSIPLVVVGAFPALALSGTPIGLPVFFGFLLLVGIVVTNAIVLIDLVEKLRDGGTDVRSAIIEGGARRVRPIVMTALCTILALIPVAVGLSKGGGIVGQPLAVTVIGGLTSSTLLTLFVVPALYSAVEGLKRRVGVVRRPPQTFEAPPTP